MKELIKQRLNESLKGGTYTIYHGSPTKIIDFTDDFVGGKDAVDQEGPGIYFTSSIEDAKMYGEFIYTATFTPRLLYDQTPTNYKKLRPLVTKMTMLAPNWEMHAQNYHENPRLGVNQFVDSALEYNDTEKDVVQQIWYDFYKNEPVDYVRNMVKMGIDGLMIKKEHNEIIHFIIYNPAALKVVG